MQSNPLCSSRHLAKECAQTGHLGSEQLLIVASSSLSIRSFYNARNSMDRRKKSEGSCASLDLFFAEQLVQEMLIASHWSNVSAWENKL